MGSGRAVQLSGRAWEAEAELANESLILLLAQGVASPHPQPLQVFWEPDSSGTCLDKCHFLAHFPHSPPPEALVTPAPPVP